ncbi:hypothetical protein K8I61_01010 [bacterium]|nr:hypothetical protein [bacterium]
MVTHRFSFARRPGSVWAFEQILPVQAKEIYPFYSWPNFPIDFAVAHNGVVHVLALIDHGLWHLTFPEDIAER